MSTVLVQAAGGIVCRPGPADLTEIVVVHRPRYDDWTLPKGKLDPGETMEEAAVREVAEETGLHCTLVRAAGTTQYIDRRGREKVVKYWVMWPMSGKFLASDEVDEIRWLTVEEALPLLSYQRDRDLLGGVVGL
ncbi:MAG TPA: NUDIX hydrolase [Candidatus Dormibacteraeota bacterium]|nr:NUDIX hydrolase [Candidatus Dormibacteraeota bacterium]